MNATRGRGRPPKLSREHILDTAREMDLRALSVVKVAAALQVSDAAIYYYFPTRAALVRALVDQGTAEFEVPAIGADWWHGMKAYALLVYDALIAAPGAAQSMIGGGIAGPVQMRIFGIVIRRLVDVGQDRKDAAMIYSAYFRAALYAAFAHDEHDLVGSKGLSKSERTELAIDAGEASGIELSPFVDDHTLYESRRQLEFLLDVISDGFSSR